MTIRILPPEVASRIAAGEVVERPSSIVKELVENSLDAGARRISVEANEGGIALIRVVDDGQGIEPEELALAFHRHATSKLADGAGLDSIVTLGFRGEALPSIAAVADVEAVSRTPASPIAARVRLRYGDLAEQRAGGGAPGTAIAVRALFREQPARLKFLRSPASEAAQIASVVSHYALAYPEVAFALRLDGRDVFSTAGDGDLRGAATGVYGAAVASLFIETEDQGEGHSLRALLAPPSVSRASRNYITVFINRRWVRSRSLAFAVEEAYSGLLPSGRFPIAVVDLRLPAADVDVNVHPAKAEVRLRNDRLVFSLVQRPLRRALAGLAPAGSQANAGWPRMAAIMPVEPPPTESLVLEPQPAHLGLTGQPQNSTSPVSQPSLVSSLPILRPLGQAGTTYVIAEGPAGLYLIDQHAAHERVLYERFLAAESEAKLAQPLLAPVVLELSPQEQALALTMAPAMREQGFEFEPFGPGGYLLRAAPAGLRRDDPARAFRELLELLTREDAPVDPRRRVAASLACHAAVRAGQSLAPQEMRDLLRQLEACETPQTCPHGRPTMLHLSADELARRFSRK